MSFVLGFTGLFLLFGTAQATHVDNVTCHKFVADRCMQHTYQQKECPEGWLNNGCPTPTPTPTYHHYACVENSCKLVTGKGDNSCNPQWEESCGSVTPTPTPSPEVTPTPTPSGPVYGVGGNPVTTPTCPDGNTSKPVANLHVTRNGTQATVVFFITEGDSANIYYKVSGQANWQYSVLDVKGIDVAGTNDKFVSYTINDLMKGVDYDFGIQQKFGCAGGQIVTAVVHDSYLPATFGLSWYQW